MSQETLPPSIFINDDGKAPLHSRTTSHSLAALGILFLALTLLSFPGQWLPKLLEIADPPPFQLELFVIGILCSMLNIRWYLRCVNLFLVILFETLLFLPSGVSIGDVFTEGIESIQSLGQKTIFLALCITILTLPAIYVFCNNRIHGRTAQAAMLAVFVSFGIQNFLEDQLFQINIYRTLSPQLLRTIIFEPDLILRRLSIFHTPIQQQPHLSLLASKLGNIKNPTVVIVVESLGEDLRPHHSKIDELITKRHCPNGQNANSEQGLTSFPGFTIQMEIQQLCSAKMNSFSDRIGEAQCLPRQSKLTSYAYHNNSLTFYRRDVLYKEMGFNNIYSPTEMSLQRDLKIPFNSANDSDVSSFIIKNAQDNIGFHYWMTIDMHSPYSPWRRPNHQLEENSESRLRIYEELRAGTLNSIGKMIESLPNYDFFIIGDHAPKFFDSDANSRFDRQHVPFVVIRSCELNRQEGGGKLALR